jgi:hypothetical protein
MKMDTLFWTQLNPTVKIENSKKQFYNKFLYKLVMIVPGANIIQDNIKNPELNTTICARISKYNKYTLTRRHFGVNVKNNDRKRKLAEEKQINQYIKFVSKNRDNLHLRYETPCLSIYSNDIDLLKSLAKSDRENLVGFHGPSDEQAKQAIERGEIIVKRINGYNLKIFLKEIIDIDLEEKKNIINCLTNMGDVVKLPLHCKNNLERPYRWMASSYFYAQDDGIITLLNLIRPGIVQGIFKLSLQPDK